MTKEIPLAYDSNGYRSKLGDRVFLHIYDGDCPFLEPCEIKEEGTIVLDGENHFFLSDNKMWKINLFNSLYDTTECVNLLCIIFYTIHNIYNLEII